MRRLLILGLAAAAAWGQVQINGNRTIDGTFDFRNAARTLPHRSGTGSPVARDACTTIGETYFQTNATAGLNTFACTAPGTPGTWTLQGDGGGSGGTGVVYCSPASASGTAFTCTPSPALSSYTQGTTLAFVPDVNGTAGAITVNVSALGAKSIKMSDGTTNPLGSTLVAGQVVGLVYDGAVFRVQAPMYDPTKSGAELFQGVTSGGVAIAVADVAGTLITYVLPSTNGTAGQILSDSGTTTCPTLPSGFPSTCHLLTWVSTTGSGNVVLATSPTLVTPNLGTPSAVTLTNGTGLPVSGISGLGTGVGTFLGTPTSANLAGALTDETGSGAAVFATSPTLTTPNLGTPSAINLTNATGFPSAQSNRYVECSFDGGGSTITTNSICYKRIPVGATIVGWSIIAVGSSPACTIDVLKIASGGTLPTSSITASATPALTSTNNAGFSSTLTGWTTSVTANDLLGFKVTVPGAATWANIQLFYAVN